MALQDIMVVLDDTAQGDSRLSGAVSLAHQHGAFLTGFCPLDMLRTVAPIRRSETFAPLQPGAMPETETNLAEVIERVEMGFRDRIRFDGVRGDWLLGSGNGNDAILHQARQADVVIVGQVNPDQPPPARRHLAEDILLAAGRPILIVPYAGQFAGMGTNVVIGWNDTREAARAVKDSLPFLTEAASVTILHAFTAGRKEPDDAVTSGITRYLSHHGIDAAVARLPIAGISASDAMLSYAADAGADLMVTGGYGHSRLRELVLGGVTRGLLQHMTVPILMSH